MRCNLTIYIDLNVVQITQRNRAKSILLKKALTTSVVLIIFMESLILAQDERWRHGLGMQVERM